MSLKPQEVSPIPEETIRVAHAAFPKGNALMRLRDILGPIYTDAQFMAFFLMMVNRRSHQGDWLW